MARSWLTRWFTNRVRPVRKKVSCARFLPTLEPLAERVLPAVTATFSAGDGTLRVTGDELDNNVVVSRTADGTILVNGGAVAIEGGRATVANTALILLNGGAGNDTLSLSEANGALPAAAISGGVGNDVLTGGSGNDTFVWNPGDGSDTVDGQAGTDTLRFVGADVNENIALSANGPQARLTRDGGVTMDLSGLEVVNVLPLGGADTITVNDLSGTGVRVVNLALGATATSGDGQPDTVIINGTNGNDNIHVVGTAAGNPVVNVGGLSAQVSILEPDGLGDSLVINGLGGNDTVDTSNLAAGVIGLTVNLGDGQAGAATTTTLRTSIANAVFGQTVLLTATVNSPAGVPTGMVTFFDGNRVLSTVPVNAAGQAVLGASFGVGNHAVTASFTGSGDFTASTSAAVAVTVNRAATLVTLASSLNPAVTGQAVTFTATVAAIAPGFGTPTGTVTFKDGGVILGTVPVGPGGRAALTTSFAAAGGHVITAVYNGDPNYVGSTQALTEQVNAATTRTATTTTLAASLNPVLVGQPITFTATVRGPAGSGTPTGAVTFFVNNVAVATVRLDANGQARLSGFFSRTGLFSIRAAYSGDARFAASSGSLNEQVS
jgi:hypothetical protein